MAKPVFFYANGTAFLVNVFEIGFAVSMGLRVTVNGVAPENYGHAMIAGLNGDAAPWSLAPEDDPFPALLNPDKWFTHRIKYPALAYPMGASIDYGVTETISQINKMVPGTPFALGGYSQGAAVMSGVYNEIRYGSLTSRASDFLGAVNFGNPRRQLNHRGAVGGNWSGAWDVPDSTTGGHGSFPTTGSWARLQNCGEEWIEFAMPDDMFSSTGDSADGTNWTAGNEVILDLDATTIFNYFSQGMADDIWNSAKAAFATAYENTFVDAVGKEIKIGGGGHTAYPFVPPVGDPFSGATSYQIALAYLDILADDWATAPIALPSNSAGWSTTLLPPG